MKSFVAVLVLLCSNVVMSRNDIDNQLRSGDDQSLKNEIQAEVQETEAIVSNQENCQPDIQTLLRELSVKLAEQSVELRYTKSQMSTMEKQLEELKKQNEASEKQLKDLKKENEVAEIRLKTSEKQLEAQAQELGTLQMRSNITENHIRELSRENGNKFAFSASLYTSDTTTSTGPFNTPFTLKYTNIFVNTGKAYNPNTGIFTAPVRGVYTFRFSITGFGTSSTTTGAHLFKNGRHVVIAYCRQPTGIVSTTNGASLLLEVGDVVYVQLYPTSQLLDNGNFYNTFSGQLLFTV